MIDSALDPAFAAVFGPAERHGSAVLAGGEHPDVQLAAALALWAPVHGHTCVALGDVAAQFATDEAIDDAAALPWPGAGIEASTRPLAGSILSMRASAIW